MGCPALLHSPYLIGTEEAVLPPRKSVEFGFLGSQAGCILGRGPGKVSSNYSEYIEGIL